MTPSHVQPRFELARGDAEAGLLGAGEPLMYLDFDGVLGHEAVYWCRRRLNFDPPCRLSFDPGMDAGIVDADCG